MKGIWLLLISFLFLFSCGADTDLFEFVEFGTSIELVFPENASECNEGTVLSDTESEVTFRWTNQNDDISYLLYLTNLLTDSTEVYESTETRLPIVLKRGTPYSWFVLQKDLDDNISEAWTFYNAGLGIENFIPFPAIAISPKSEDVLSVSQSTIDLDWDASDLDGDITEYDVYFGPQNPPSLYKEGIEQSTLSDIPISSTGIYYWKIVTRDTIGNESISDIFQFVIN